MFSGGRERVCWERMDLEENSSETLKIPFKYIFDL